MKTQRYILILIAMLTLLALATSALAQVNPDDRDGDGVPNVADRCPDVPGPRSNGGCPLEVPTQAPGRVDDRDGDGVLDFVDQCPDQAGTGFTEGCPPDQGQPSPQGTPTIIPPQPVRITWLTDERCMVANLGSQNVNVRVAIPSSNSRVLPDVIGLLAPGDQFAPLYVQQDANGTPWYAALGIADESRTAMGWVSGAVTSTHGDCGGLGAPPTRMPHADEPVCLLIVAVVGGADVHTEPSTASPVVATLEQGAVFPGVDSANDSDGLLWFLGAQGWVRAAQVDVQGNCNFANPIFTRVGGDITLIDPPNNAGSTCTITVPQGDGAKLYYAMLHDEGIVVFVLPPGYTSKADGSGLDNDGHMWYALGSGWVDSADVIAAGACENIPLPPAGDGDCLVWIPSEGADASVFQQPAAESDVIGTIPAGSMPVVTAKTVDANNATWYYVVMGSGWIQGDGLTLVNPAKCAELTEVAPPAADGACVVTVVGDSAGLFAAPSHDGSGLYGGAPAGNSYPVEGIDYDEDGNLWYNLGGAWIDSSEVVTSGDCANLPIYHPTGIACEVLIPYASTVPMYASYLADPLVPSGQIAGPDLLDATFAGTDTDGVRWYYVSSQGEYGWVSSFDVIETIPAVCDELPPMILLPPINLIEIELHPIVIPWNQPTIEGYN